MKKLVKDYTFYPLTKTISIDNCGCISLEQILTITNVTDNIMIYLFADSSLGGYLNDSKQLVLDYDTTGMSASDSLQIFIEENYEDNVYEIAELKEQYTFDTNLNNVFGSQPLIDGGNLKTKTVYADYSLKSRIGSSNEQFGINTQGCPTALVQISGTWAGTISFEAFGDGGNFVAINGIATNGTSLVTSTTANGIFRFNVAGLQRLQARFSTYTSGTALITLIASAESAGVFVSNVPTTSGSQSQPLSQKATTYELNTYDTNLLTVLGASKLWRDGFYTTDFPIAPTINPTQPTTYAATRYSKYPQIFPRLMVESGGSERLPFAQEKDTNRLKITTNEERRLLEEILYQLTQLNQMFSVANNVDLKLDYNENKK